MDVASFSKPELFLRSHGVVCMRLWARREKDRWAMSFVKTRDVTDEDCKQFVGEYLVNAFSATDISFWRKSGEKGKYFSCSFTTTAI